MTNTTNFVDDCEFFFMDDNDLVEIHIVLPTYFNQMNESTKNRIKQAVYNLAINSYHLNNISPNLNDINLEHIDN